MKKMMIMFCSMFAIATLAQAMTLAEANAQIDKAIADPALVTKIVRALPIEWQTNFLASVNKAIESQPGNAASKVETFIEVNRAALKGAQASGNVAPMLAEVYATVPVGVLPAVSTSFAADLFNRASDPSITFTDAQYEAIAKNLMTLINSRTAATDDSGARSALAAEMFALAANGVSESLANTLATALPAELAGKAQAEGWFKGDAANTAAILAAVGVEAAVGVDAATGAIIGGDAKVSGATSASSGTGFTYALPVGAADPTVLDSMIADLATGGTAFTDNANAPGNAALPVRDSGNVVPAPSEPQGYRGKGEIDN